MQGKSMLPILEGNTPKDWRKAHYYHYYEHPSEHDVRRHYGITTDRYMLIHFYYDLDKWELYDFQKDPNELNNVYGDLSYASIQKELHKELEQLRVKYGDNDAQNRQFIEQYYEKVKANPLVEYWKLSPEKRKRLYQEYL